MSEFFIIKPLKLKDILLSILDKSRIKNGKKVKLGFEYISHTNNVWMSKSQIKKWISKNFSNQ